MNVDRAIRTAIPNNPLKISAGDYIYRLRKTRRLAADDFMTVEYIVRITRDFRGQWWVNDTCGGHLIGTFRTMAQAIETCHSPVANGHFPMIRSAEV